MTYISVAHARSHSGVRAVFTRGIPVPWGEAVKGFLHIKGIPHVRVAQEAGQDNAELVAWAGLNSAPILVYEDEPAQDRWSNILLRLEEIQPNPPLIPQDEEDRAAMFGMCYEVLDADGYIWNRRIWLIAQPESTNKTLPPEAIEKLRSKYAYASSAQDRPVRRMIEVLVLLGRRLRAQRERGSRYYIGNRLTALDVYAATAFALTKPLPDSVCPMEAGMRFNYTERVPEILNAVDPLLAEHRNYIYEKYLELPIQL
jgi:glutathione S-transferase